METDYIKYRGKCREYCEREIDNNPELSLVRGFYICPIWGKQDHWWCVEPDGTIVDPTKYQFPSKGLGEYQIFDGTVECAECSRTMTEEEASYEGRFPFCSLRCKLKFVGL